MSRLCLELSRCPDWTQSRWNGEPVHTHDTHKLIEVGGTRVWISPSGKTFLEEAAYSVASGLSQESEYAPVIPTPAAPASPSLYLVNRIP
jgi:hypothetical protein